MNFFLTRILPWLLVIILGAGLWFALKPKPDTYSPPSKPSVTHDMILEKIEALGKLELTRFYIKDIMTRKKVSSDIIPLTDDNIILIISGEVIGCIDLTKIDSSDVIIGKDSIIVTLPEPERCSYKINHQDSKIYQINTGVYSSIDQDAAYIEYAYKLAEIELPIAAKKMGILEETRKNAQLVLKPILEMMTGKKVILK